MSDDGLFEIFVYLLLTQIQNNVTNLYLYKHSRYLMIKLIKIANFLLHIMCFYSISTQLFPCLRPVFTSQTVVVWTARTLSHTWWIQDFAGGDTKTSGSTPSYSFWKQLKTSALRWNRVYYRMMLSSVQTVRGDKHWICDLNYNGD